MGKIACLSEFLEIYKKKILNNGKTSMDEPKN